MQFKSWDGVGTEVMWEGRRLFDVRWPVGMGINCCPGLSLMTNIIFCELWSPNGHPTDHNAVTMKQQNYDKKTWQLQMHCNLRQPDAAQSLCALISSPVPSSKSLSLSVAVLAFLLLIRYVML